MNYNELLNLIEIAEKSSFKTFEVNFENTHINLSKLDTPSFDNRVQMPSVVAIPSEPIVAEVKTEATTKVEAKEEVEEKGNVVTSPIVGTFYSSPSSEKPNFVKVGDTVKEGDVLCIVEAMKVMNEVKSKYSGVVKKVLIENETLVEYGQRLFIIG